MKYSCQLPVSQYTRYSQYTPTHYTPTQHTPTHYTATHYTAQYSLSKYSTPAYDSATYKPPLYTPTHKTYSSYTPSYSKGSRYTPAKPAPKPAPPAAVKPARTVRFTNDIIFQDHVRHGELELIGRFVRARKVRLDTLFPSGMAPLHEAVLSGNLECVKLLVKYGADVHQRDEDGWTALHMACSDGFPEIARYLLSLGASAEAENEKGEKPADLIDPDCKELVKLFAVGAV